MRTKNSPDIIPFAQSCTGGQNPLHGFDLVTYKSGICNKKEIFRIPHLTTSYK